MASAVGRGSPHQISSASPIEVEGEEGEEKREEEGEFVEAELGEEQGFRNCRELNATILDLRHKYMTGDRGIIQKGRNGNWELNPQHPWLVRAERCAKRVDALYNALEGQEIGGNERKIREVVRLKESLSELQGEIRQYLPRTPEERRRQYVVIGGAVCAMFLVTGLIVGLYFAKVFPI